MIFEFSVFVSWFIIGMGSYNRFPEVLVKLHSSLDYDTVTADGLALFRDTCISAFAAYNRSLLSANLVAELVRIFRGTAQHHTKDFDSGFWCFVTALENVVLSPSGPPRDVALQEFRQLLKKYPATVVFSSLDALVTQDWFMFHREDSEEALCQQTKFLKVRNKAKYNNLHHQLSITL